MERRIALFVFVVKLVLKEGLDLEEKRRLLGHHSVVQQVVACVLVLLRDRENALVSDQLQE